MKRTHGTGVAQALGGSFLPTKVGEGIETVRVVETFLVFSMAAFHLSIVAGFQVTLAVGEAIGELKTVIGLDTLDGNAFAGKMLDDLA